MQTLKIILLLLPLCLGAQDNLSTFATDVPHYTVQVKSFPAHEKAKALQLYESLKNKNYLVYYTKKFIDDQQYYRVRVEVFDAFSKAKAFAEKFKEKEGFDYFIDKTTIEVENFQDLFAIVSTPQGIFYRDSTKVIELAKGQQTRLSRDGRQIVFVYKSDIYTLDIQTKTKRLLKDFEEDSDLALNLQPQWSPDGHYISYLPGNCWECNTALWIIRADGTGDRCLVAYDQEKSNRVKYQLWHPLLNKIFYVYGYAYGTVSVGGSIYVTDLQGNSELFVAADKNNREEIYKELRLVNNTLHYKMVRFKENYNGVEYSSHTKDITDID